MAITGDAGGGGKGGKGIRCNNAIFLFSALLFSARRINLNICFG